MVKHADGCVCEIWNLWFFSGFLFKLAICNKLSCESSILWFPAKLTKNGLENDRFIWEALVGTEEESHRHHPRIRRERPTGLIICPSAIQKGPIFLDFPSYPSSVLVGISRHLFYSSVTIDLNLLTPPLMVTGAFLIALFILIQNPQLHSTWYRTDDKIQ